MKDTPMTDLSTSTPSQRAGIRVTPRMPPFQFDADSVPEAWFEGDAGKLVMIGWEACQCEHDADERAKAL